MVGVQLAVDGSNDSPDWHLPPPPGCDATGWGTLGPGSGIPPSACAVGAAATASAQALAVSSFTTQVDWTGIIALPIRPPAYYGLDEMLECGLTAGTWFSCRPMHSPVLWPVQGMP